jgi:hypothetical protein
LQKTYLNQIFYWDDSGRADKTRVIIFTTENNLRLLQQIREWLADGIKLKEKIYFHIHLFWIF